MDFTNNKPKDPRQRDILTEGQIAYANYLCRKYTGYNTIFDMGKNYPTLRIDRKGNCLSAKEERTEMQHLRELYACVSGRPAFGISGLTDDALKKSYSRMMEARCKEVA